MIFSQKNILKDNISSITEKDDNYPRNYGTFSDRKIKDDKKVYFYKKVAVILCAIIQIFIGLFKYCFPMKQKTRNLIYRTEI